VEGVNVINRRCTQIHADNDNGFGFVIVVVPICVHLRASAVGNPAVVAVVSTPDTICGSSRKAQG
jgi:hypothetical protein